MSAAAAEHPLHQPSLLELAERISRDFEGCRVEIIGSQLIVSPPADGSHAESLTDLMVPFLAAGLHGEQARVLQAIGLWLPDGPSDYVIPDLAVVDADYRDHLAEHGCYEPAVFRLVVEVTSANHRMDLMAKPTVYAGAGIPVYMIIDRRNRRVRVLTDPQGGEYRVHAVHHPGQSFELPGSIGALVKLEVDGILGPEV